MIKFKKQSRNITTFVLLFVVCLLNAQDNSLKALEFLTLIDSEKVITEHYDKYRNKVFGLIPAIFEANGLDVNNEIHVSAFKDQINKSIDYYTQAAIIKTANIYSGYDAERLDICIELAKTEPDFEKVLVFSKFAMIADNIIKEDGENIAYDMPLFVQRIKAKSDPLRLQVIIDNDTIQDLRNIELDLQLITSNEKYSTIKILNRTTSEISIPEDLAYVEMEYVILKYNNEEHAFFENHYEKLPKELKAVMTDEVKELHNPISKSCFEDLLFWEIRIDNDPENNPDFELIKDRGNPDEKVTGLISFKTQFTTFKKLK